MSREGRDGGSETRALYVLRIRYRKNVSEIVYKNETFCGSLCKWVGLGVHPAIVHLNAVCIRLVASSE